MSWRLIACRPNGDGSEDLITSDIPVDPSSEVTVSLSGPTVMKIVLPMYFAHMKAGDGTPVFTPWATTIYAERNGTIIGGGIVDDMDDEGGVLSLSVIGFVGYLQDMPFMSEYAGYNVDPMAIARLIWNHVQSQPGGNLGLVFPGLRTNRRIGVHGVPAFRGRPEIKDAAGNVVTKAIPPTPEIADEPYIMAWHQTADLLEEFNKLAKLTPFDYVERHYWAGDKIVHRLDVGHPMWGRKRANLRFVPGENVLEAPKVYEHGSLYASDVLLLGAGEGRTKIHAVSNHAQRGRLRRVAVINAPSIMRNETAKRLADNEIKYRTGDPAVADFTVVDHPNAPLGGFGVGDTVYVQGGSDWYTDAETWVRIASIKYTLGDPDRADVVAVKEGAD